MGLLVRGKQDVHVGVDSPIYDLPFLTPPTPVLCWYHPGELSAKYQYWVFRSISVIVVCRWTTGKAQDNL